MTPDVLRRSATCREAVDASTRRFSSSLVKAERRLAHSACIPCSGFGAGAGKGVGVVDGVKLGVVTGDGDLVPPDGKGGAKRVGGRVNGGVEGFDGGGVISPNFNGAPNKAEAGEPRLNDGTEAGKEKGASIEAAESGVDTGNGLALMPGLGVKLDKSGGVPGRDDVSSFLGSILRASMGALGAAGVTIVGGADLDCGGGAVESGGSTSPTSGVLASGELRAGRLLLIRGVRLNGEFAGGEDFETGAGREGRSPSLTGEQGGVVLSSLTGDVCRPLAEGDGT